MENLTPVTLVVKAANQKIADQTVECALNWTVKKLKQHLSAVYPNKPIATQQRIIYSGQLLQDDLTLKDVLRQYEPNQTIHTVHLVCSTTTSTTDSPSFQTPFTNTPVDNVNVSTSEGLRQRHVQSTEPRPVAGHQQSSGNEMPSPPSPFMYPTMAQGYSPEQMMWIQQSYAQYMAQYMQYYQTGLYSQGGLQPVAAYEGYFNPVANVNILPNNNVDMNPIIPAAADVNRVAMPRQAGGPEIVRMNAQGGPVVNDDDDDMQNRDWLDWIYVFLRFSILLCILYFYSTFGRIIATLVLVVFIYLYQIGWFQLNRRIVAAPRQPNVVTPAEQQQAPVEDSDNQGENAAANTTPPAPAEPSRMAVVWTFVVSFFSSLAPQQPPPVNIN